jgi:hypothetical protein
LAVGVLGRLWREQFENQTPTPPRKGTKVGGNLRSLIGGLNGDRHVPLGNFLSGAENAYFLHLDAAEVVLKEDRLVGQVPT